MLVISQYYSDQGLLSCKYYGLVSIKDGSKRQFKCQFYMHFKTFYAYDSISIIYGNACWLLVPATGKPEFHKMIAPSFIRKHDNGVDCIYFLSQYRTNSALRWPGGQRQLVKLIYPICVEL